MQAVLPAKAIARCRMILVQSSGPTPSTASWSMCRTPTTDRHPVAHPQNSSFVVASTLENRLKNYKSGMERIGSQALMLSVCLINMVMAVRKRQHGCNPHGLRRAYIKQLVSRVNGSRWEFDASSVGAKVREGLTDGANKIFDVLYENYHGKKANSRLRYCSLKCSVATEPPVDVEWLVVKCTLHRTLTEQEMLDSGYGETYPPATEYNCECLTDSPIMNA